MSGSRLRVALISSSFAPHYGGVEEHVAQVASRLARDGYGVEVWTVDRGERPPDIAWTGCRVRYLPAPLPARSRAAVTGFVRQALPAWRQWATAVREFRPDALHAHCFGPNGIYALALHRRFRLPLLITSHGETMGDDSGAFARSKLLRTALRSAISTAAAVTAPSEYVLRDLRADYGLSGGAVIPNGVEEAGRIRDRASPAGDAPYLLAYGRLGRMKGFDLLIDAFAGARVDGVRLVLGGDGDERGALIEQIRAAGVSDRVHLPGRLNAEQVASAVSGAIAVVVPSRSEAFGIVALEAWRGGAPLVMTSRGGAAEFMTDGEDALLVDPEDVPALRASLERVAADPELRRRLAERGRHRVRDFSWDRVTEMYRRLYDGLTPSGSNPSKGGQAC